MRTVIPFVAFLMLSGCDEVVRTEPAGYAHEANTTLSCTAPGFCFTCLPGFDGKSDCTIKYSLLCPGTQSARVSIQPVIRHHKSGKVTSDEVTSVVSTGQCIA